MGEATKGIMQKARMAKDLYEQQAAIESQVKERWAHAYTLTASPPLSSCVHACLYALMLIKLLHLLPSLCLA